MKGRFHMFRGLLGLMSYIVKVVIGVLVSILRMKKVRYSLNALFRTLKGCVTTRWFVIGICIILVLTYLSGCSLLGARSHRMNIKVDCPDDNGSIFSLPEFS